MGQSVTLVSHYCTHFTKSTMLDNKCWPTFVCRLSAALEATIWRNYSERFHSHSCIR